MNRIGFSLVDVATGEELQTWVAMPSVVSHGGEDRTGAIVGAEFSGGALLVERFCGSPPFGEPAVLSESATFDGSKVIVSRKYADPDLGLIRANLISKVKAEAGALILAYCPQYKQANLTARAAELALTFPGTAGLDLPEPYRSEFLMGQAIWDHIKSIRAHSDVMETEINNLSSPEELRGWKAHDWPTK